jgi:hypothetical protein
VTVTCGIGEKLALVYIDHEKAEEFADPQKKSLAVELVRTNEVV